MATPSKKERKQSIIVRQQNSNFKGFLTRAVIKAFLLKGEGQDAFDIIKANASLKSPRSNAETEAFNNAEYTTSLKLPLYSPDSLQKTVHEDSLRYLL